MQHGNIPAARSARAALVLGLALYWPSLKQFELASVLFSAGSWALRTVPLAAAFGFVVFAAIVVARRKDIEPLLVRRRGVVCLLCALGSLGYALLAVAGSASAVSLLVGGFLVAAGYTAMTFGYMDALVRMGARAAVAVLPVSCLLSCALSLIAYLPNFVCLSITVATPLLCGCALLLQGGATRQNVDWSVSAMTGIPVLPVATLGLFLVIARIAIGTFNDVDARISMDQRLFTLALVALVTVWMLGVVARRPVHTWGFTLRIGWCVPAIVAMVGVFLLVSPDEACVHAGLGALGSSLDCLEIFLWLNLVLAVQECTASSVLVFALAFSLFKMVPLVLGKVAIPLVAGGAATSVGFFPVALTMMLLLVTATVAYLTSTAVSLQAAGTDEEAYSDPRGDALEVIASEAGLTARETEIMDYLSQGYTFHAMADALGISAGTAQGYSKALYRKLGVHSKQEAVDVLHRRMAATPGGRSDT